MILHNRELVKGVFSVSAILIRDTLQTMYPLTTDDVISDRRNAVIVIERHSTIACFNRSTMSVRL